MMQGDLRDSRRPPQGHIFQNDLPENGLLAQALDGVENFNAGQAPAG